MKTNTASAQDIAPENVAIAAYHRWLAAGKPCGRDQEFWLRAESDLRKLASQIPQANQAPVEARTERTQPYRTAPASHALHNSGQRDKQPDHRSQVMNAV